MVATSPIRRVLGLDLGTTVGWARTLVDDDLFTFGCWDLSGEGGPAAKALAFSELLLDAIEGPVPVDLVVFEHVQFVVSLAQIQTYTALEVTMKMICTTHEIPVMPVPPGTLKKWVTGNGRAKKQEMVDAANKKLASARLQEGVAFPLGKKDHDIADALHLAMYGVAHAEEEVA